MQQSQPLTGDMGKISRAYIWLREAGCHGNFAAFRGERSSRMCRLQFVETKQAVGWLKQNSGNILQIFPKILPVFLILAHFS